MLIEYLFLLSIRSVKLSDRHQYHEDGRYFFSQKSVTTVVKFANSVNGIWNENIKRWNNFPIERIIKSHENDKICSLWTIYSLKSLLLSQCKEKKGEMKLNFRKLSSMVCAARRESGRGRMCLSFLSTTFLSTYTRTYLIQWLTVWIWNE